MKRITFARLAVLMLAVAGLVLQGCGGDDGVNPTTHMDVEAERDMYKAQVAQLQATLGDETDPAPDSVRGMLAAAQADATMYMNMANNLQTTLGDETDPAPDSVRGMLAAAQADATMYMNTANDLRTTLGDETDPAPDSVRGMLAAAQADVTMYTTLLGDETNPDPDSVRGMLAAAQGDVTMYMNMANNLQTTLGDETDPAPESVRGMLAAAQGDVTMYMNMANNLQTTLGDETDPAPESVRGMLAAANARIGSDDDPDSLLGQIATLTARVAALEAGTDSTVLDPVKTAASSAADDAETAETDADEAADEAATAAMNRATIQTSDADSVMHAKDAKMHADTAMTKAGEARDASDDAQAAMSVAEATPHRTAAEAARDDAQEAQRMAEAARGMAQTDAMMELKIDDKTKSVGDTRITIDGQGRSVVENGRLVETGLIDSMKITTPGMRTATGQPVMFGDPPAVVSGREAAAADIGVTYDSGDDSARLTLITSYLGTRKEMQFLRASVTANPFDGASGAPTHVVPTAGQDIEPGTNGSVLIPANAGSNTAAITEIPRVAGSQFRAVNNDGAGTASAPSVLYYVPSKVRDTTVGDMDDGIDQTKVFLERSINQGTVTYDVVAVIEVTLDAPSSYEHLHYGLWNGLSGSGMNTVSDLGIAFVHAIADGDGMTAADDMPNHGSATYSGNYVANVRAADADGDGAITRQDGTATIMADFDDNEIDITLSGLAMLTGGEIDDNMFSGTKVSLIDSVEDDTNDNATLGIQLEAGTSASDGGLVGTGDYTGTFSGGFFGPVGREAGGIFDYTSDDMEDGEFRGSFGGRRD